MLNRTAAAVCLAGEADLQVRRRRIGMSDFNHDGLRDLIVGFDGREAGIALGDTLVCLSGATRAGAVIEACAKIDTRPRAKRGRQFRRRK